METPLNPQPVKPKSKWPIIGLAVIAVAIGLFVLFKPSASSTSAGKPAQKEPLLHRDEPTKGQIFQEDYKDKVKELLDSGKNVSEVSRETGIRKDVVRKIKKGKE
ncbi:MAG TPA: hypothetical protein PLW44_05220 [Chitinophagales bacterium]|nr:hypothetical protein [Chitinophagales bacterium]